jgi:ATP-dependent protease ClpP protease subunit
MQPNWYEIKASADSADVMIYNEIGGWGITAEAFANDIGKIKAKTINVRINSPGGSVFDAFAIFNALRNHSARVVAHVDGLAASAASVIMLAGDETRIAKNGYVMIHNASAGVYGDAEAMMQTAALLEKLNNTVADTYAEKTKKTREDMLSLMAAETWMNAEEAKAMGLVDAITDEAESLPAAAASAVAKFQRAPEQLRRIAAKYIETSGPNAITAASATGATVAKQENTMNLEAFKAFATEHPEAVASFIDQGKKAGIAEARESLKALIEASAGNTAVALDAFYAGQDAEQVNATIAAIAKATADKDAELKAQAAEIAKLKAQVGTQSAVGTAAAAAEGEKVAAPITDPKAAAKSEWDAMTPEQKDKWASEAIFVRVRAKELAK